MSTLELAPQETAYVDRDGEELGMLKWFQLFADEDYSTVAATDHHDATVLTRWLGVADNLQVGILYATHIWQAGQSRLVWHAHWPATEADAQAAHELVVARLREGQPPALSTCCH